MAKKTKSASVAVAVEGASDGSAKSGFIKKLFIGTIIIIVLLLIALGVAYALTSSTTAAGTGTGGVLAGAGTGFASSTTRAATTSPGTPGTTTSTPNQTFTSPGFTPVMVGNMCADSKGEPRALIVDYDNPTPRTKAEILAVPGGRGRSGYFNTTRATIEQADIDKASAICAAAEDLCAGYQIKKISAGHFSTFFLTGFRDNGPNPQGAVYCMKKA